MLQASRSRCIGIPDLTDLQKVGTRIVYNSTSYLTNHDGYLASVQLSFNLALLSFTQLLFVVSM